MEGFCCSPVHEGPFFYERHNFMKCDACGRRVTDDHVRASARAGLDLAASVILLSLPLDGNEVQRLQSAERVCGLLNSVQQPFRTSDEVRP